jgi:hypothetical protein
MTYGLYLGGDDSRLLITSESKSMVFVGKPTFVSVQGIGGNFPAYYYNYFGTTLYNWPLASIYRYSFSSGTRNMVYFVHAEYPKKSSVIGVEKTNGVDTIFVASSWAGAGTSAPTVYAFAETNNVPTSGFGMNVLRSDGTPAFTTQDNSLFVSRVYQHNSQESSLRASSIGSFNYVGNGPSYQNKTLTYSSPLASSSEAISKPIIYFPAPQSATWKSSTSQLYFYELCASFNSNTGNLEFEWINTFFSVTSGSNFNVSEQPRFAMVADGALYD